jgi:hypothetical protein
LPDERALTWLALSLEKVGLGTLARAAAATLAWAAEPAAMPAAVVIATPSAAAPSSEAARRRVKDILLPLIPARPRVAWV